MGGSTGEEWKGLNDLQWSDTLENSNGFIEEMRNQRDKIRCEILEVIHKECSLRGQNPGTNGNWKVKKIPLHYMTSSG